MADEQNNEVAPATNTMPTLTPDQIARMQKDSGKQKFNMREIMVPVLKISNTTSGVMKKSDPEYKPQATEGDFYDTLTFSFYTPPIELIVVRFQTNYIESKPKMGPTVRLWGMDRTGYDQAVGRDVGVRTTKDGNEIREVGTYYCILKRSDGTLLPCLAYLGSTAWREARRLNAIIGSLEMMGPDGPFVLPPYGQIFKVKTVPASDGQNTWMTWSFEQAGMTLALPNGQHLYDRAHELEVAVDKSLTRIVGTQDDDRFAEDQEQRAARREVGNGPPKDEPPPPTSDEDYGGDRQATVIDKAKSAPF